MKALQHKLLTLSGMWVEWNKGNQVERFGQYYINHAPPIDWVGCKEEVSTTSWPQLFHEDNPNMCFNLVVGRLNELWGDSADECVGTQEEISD